MVAFAAGVEPTGDASRRTVGPASAGRQPDIRRPILSSVVAGSGGPNLRPANADRDEGRAGPRFATYTCRAAGRRRTAEPTPQTTDPTMPTSDGRRGPRPPIPPEIAANAAAVLAFIEAGRILYGGNRLQHRAVGDGDANAARKSGNRYARTYFSERHGLSSVKPVLPVDGPTVRSRMRAAAALTQAQAREIADAIVAARPRFATSHLQFALSAPAAERFTLILDAVGNDWSGEDVRRAVRARNAPAGGRPVGGRRPKLPADPAALPAYVAASCETWLRMAEAVGVRLDDRKANAGLATALNDAAVAVEKVRQSAERVRNKRRVKSAGR